MTLAIRMEEPRTLQEAREIAERYLNLREEAVRRPVRLISASTSNVETISEERLNSFEKKVMDVIEKRLSDILAKQSILGPNYSSFHLLSLIPAGTAGFNFHTNPLA